MIPETSIVGDQTHETLLKCVRQYQAMRKAMKDASIPATTLDLDLLLILYSAVKPLTFNGLFSAFNSPGHIYSKYRYYAALDRLQNKGFVIPQYNVKGWRLWTITPQGRRQVHRLDTAAQNYLPL